MKSTFSILLWCLVSVLWITLPAAAQQRADAAVEKMYYPISDVSIPDSIALEVGGMDFDDAGNLLVCTRRGEIWRIRNPYGSAPVYERFAYGLHEPLGLAWHEGSVYVNQRAELTKITDTNADGKADVFETICNWRLSGNYHEYAYGPFFLPDGNMLVTLNLSWVGRGESLTKWRGWMLKISPAGEVTPFAAGMRSPAGIGFNAAGDIFFSENQGDWIASGKIVHLEQGDFAGHPASLRWSQEPTSPLKFLHRSQFADSIGSMFEFGQLLPHFKQPAVIFPHTLMGISTSGIKSIPAGFGPFEGQLLVGDQGHSKVMRAYLEKVNGEYQGACFPFLEGFSSGVLRLLFGGDHSLFVGMTSRGWAATGKEPYGLQRVDYKGRVPFEIKTMEARSDGFLLTFTRPVNKAMAEQPAVYNMQGFTYIYHKSYGSPIVDQKVCEVHKAEVSADGLSVRLYISGLREGYVHQLEVDKVTSAQGEKLVHAVAYYTLNAIPDGPGIEELMAREGSHAGHHMNMNDETSAGSGCGKDVSKTVTTMPASWSGKPEVSVVIGTLPGLKYDKTDFDVKEGSHVRLVFNNTDDMLHNLIITKPGKGQAVGELALTLGLDGPQLGYVPTTDDVLYNTCLLQPETSQTIYFTAPPAGDYPFICSYPGHYQVMKGVMHVTK